MNNIFVNEKENRANISINPSFYGQAAVICACEPYLERFWIYLDFRDGRYRILMKPKNNGKADFEKVGLEFFNRMLNAMHEAVSKLKNSA